jgi:hypothetical protein
MNQDEIDRALKWGFFFSIMWLGGVGSFFAVRAGRKALKAIDESRGTLEGVERAKWCLYVGWVRIGIWVPLIAIGIVNNL